MTWIGNTVDLYRRSVGVRETYDDRVLEERVDGAAHRPDGPLDAGVGVEHEHEPRAGLLRLGVDLERGRAGAAAQADHVHLSGQATLSIAEAVLTTSSTCRPAGTPIGRQMALDRARSATASGARQQRRRCAVSNGPPCALRVSLIVRADGRRKRKREREREKELAAYIPKRAPPPAT